MLTENPLWIFSPKDKRKIQVRKEGSHEEDAERQVADHCASHESQGDNEQRQRVVFESPREVRDVLLYLPFFKSTGIYIPKKGERSCIQDWQSGSDC